MNPLYKTGLNKIAWRIAEASGYKPWGAAVYDYYNQAEALLDVYTDEQLLRISGIGPVILAALRAGPDAPFDTSRQSKPWHSRQYDIAIDRIKRHLRRTDPNRKPYETYTATAELFAAKATDDELLKVNGLGLRKLAAIRERHPAPAPPVEASDMELLAWI